MLGFPMLSRYGLPRKCLFGPLRKLGGSGAQTESWRGLILAPLRGLREFPLTAHTGHIRQGLSALESSAPGFRQTPMVCSHSRCGWKDEGSLLSPFCSPPHPHAPLRTPAICTCRMRDIGPHSPWLELPGTEMRARY